MFLISVTSDEDKEALPQIVKQSARDDKDGFIS
jgi:hypothetical protein